MKKSIFLTAVLLLCFAFSSSLKAQSKAELEEQAYAALNDRDFATAYTLFDKLNSKYPKEFDYKFKLGLSCLNYPEKKARAIEVFMDVKKESKGPEGDYYLGKAYHVNYKFDDAIPLLESYVAARANTKNKEEKELVKDAEIILSNCKNGKLLVDTKVIADIKNIGPPVNTDEDEYVPAITTDESIIVFTYRGKKSIGGKLSTELKPDPIDGQYHEDVYISRKKADSTWTEPMSIGSVNGKGNDAAISISPDGQLLFIFASTDKNEGDILVSKLEGNEFSKPEPLNKNINTESWEGSCSISADGRTLYFASERPGGVGGRDIWMSEKDASGDWGPAKNLGPKVNTTTDDDAPFIHPDGITLFYSSKGHQSIGGYDIMFSVKRDNEWTEPKSMGLPLNTTEDDRYYVINSRGDKGFFSSNRAGSGGLGKQDIYMVTPGILGDKPVIALLKGVVYGDDKPVEAKIEVLKIVQKENIGPFYSNNTTGKYLMALSPGFVYRIKVVANGFDPIEEDLDIESLNKYMETNKDFYLYTPGRTGTTTATPTTVATTDTTTPTNTTTTTPTNTSVAVNTNTPTETNTTVEGGPCVSMNLPEFGPLKGKSLNDLQVYSELLRIAGDYCAEGLVFKVQIAAYRKPENYKYGHLAQYGKPEVVDYPDGITRFTQKQFKTVKAAEVQRQKAIAKGQKDAWIVAFIGGKRYTLEELIMVDFLGKSIN
ncbi:MAG: outer membrane protein [Bacteroidetes bacterium]|nr:outer membrane protein [Bacteroidota bacterium]